MVVPYPTALVRTEYHSTTEADPTTTHQQSSYVDNSEPAQFQNSANDPADVRMQQSKHPSTLTSSAPLSALYSAATVDSDLTVDGVWRPNLDISIVTDSLGELNVTNDVVAPYIVNQKRTLMAAPAVREPEIHLPQNRPSLIVQIPPEMMPSEEQALEYFTYFFTHIHPYAPIISRAIFYQQWQTNRGPLSPLIVEAIFACTLLALGDVNQGNRWLALALSEFSLYTS